MLECNSGFLNSSNSLNYTIILLIPMFTLDTLLYILSFSPAISVASALIHPQPFHRTRHLVGLLCGAMVTQRPRASRTSEFGLVNGKKKKQQPSITFVQ